MKQILDAIFNTACVYFYLSFTFYIFFIHIHFKKIMKNRGQNLYPVLYVQFIMFGVPIENILKTVRNCLWGVL